MKHSLPRALPFTLALCLALAACGAPASESAAPSAPTAETAAAEKTAASAAIGAGEARLLRETYGDGAAYALRNVYLLGYPGYSVLTRTDYATLTETPVCDKAGCDHLTPDCPAWRFDYLGGCTLFVDGDICYEFYLSPYDGTSWGDDRLDTLEAEALAAEGPEARILVSDKTGCRRLLTTLPAVNEAGTGSWGGFLATNDYIATDDENFYILQTVTPKGWEPNEVRLASVSKTDGAVNLLHTWKEGDIDGKLSSLSLSGAQGRTLYLTYYQVSGDPESELSSRILGGGTLCYDLDTQTLRAGASWENEWSDMDSASNLGGAWGTVSVPAKHPTGYLKADYRAGALTAIDFETGEEHPLCTGLPTLEGWTDISYERTELENWYVVRVYRWNDTENEEERLFLIPRTGGEATEVTLQYYESAHGTQPIFIRDEWEGNFFCLYGYEETSFQDINKDGSLYEGTNFQELEGLLSAEDLLASTPNYRPVARWQEGAV